MAFWGVESQKVNVSFKLTMTEYLDMTPHRSRNFPLHKPSPHPRSCCRAQSSSARPLHVYWSSVTWMFRSGSPICAPPLLFSRTARWGTTSGSATGRDLCRELEWSQSPLFPVCHNNQSIPRMIEYEGYLEKGVKWTSGLACVTFITVTITASIATLSMSTDSGATFSQGLASLQSRDFWGGLTGDPAVIVRRKRKRYCWRIVITGARAILMEWGYLRNRTSCQ